MTKLENEEQRDDTASMWWTLIWSVVYGVLFIPILFIFGVWTFAILEDGLSWYKITSVLLGLCIPFSLPVSIYLMRRYYNRNKYDMTYFAACIPWIVVGALFLIDYLLSSIQKL